MSDGSRSGGAATPLPLRLSDALCIMSDALSGRLPAECDSNRRSPEVVVAELDAEVVVEIRVRQRLVVADVAPDAKGADVGHDPAAKVEAELVAFVIEEQFVALDAGLHPADAAREIGPEPAAAGAADRGADDGVEHDADGLVIEQIEIVIVEQAVVDVGVDVEKPWSKRE